MAKARSSGTVKNTRPLCKGRVLYTRVATLVGKCVCPFPSAFARSHPS